MKMSAKAPAVYTRTDYNEGDPVPPKPGGGPERTPATADCKITRDKNVVYFKEVAVKMLKK